MKIEELMRRMIRNIERDDEDRRVNAKDDKKHRRYKSCGESNVLTFEGYWIKEG